MTTENHVKTIIGERLGHSQVYPNHHLVEDLGADSLDRADHVFRG